MSQARTAYGHEQNLIFPRFDKAIEVVKREFTKVSRYRLFIVENQ